MYMYSKLGKILGNLTKGMLTRSLTFEQLLN